MDSDIDRIFQGLSHPEVIKYYGVNFDSLEATKEQMSWYADDGQYWWIVSSIDSKEFFGAAGLNDLSPEHKKAEIGIWLMPEFWGNGIMTEVMPLICDYGFNQLGLHRIEGFVETDNIGCKKAMDKVEFQYEGTMKDCEVKNGGYVSLDIYAKLNSKIN